MFFSFGVFRIVLGKRLKFIDLVNKKSSVIKINLPHKNLPWIKIEENLRNKVFSNFPSRCKK